MLELPNDCTHTVIRSQTVRTGEDHEPKPRTDIQAILTVLGNTPPPKDKGFDNLYKFDLRETDLRGAEFWNGILEWTDFWGAHLDGGTFWGAVLSNAKLERAHLAGANLMGAKLDGASLENADVTGAIFDRNTVWPHRGVDLISDVAAIRSAVVWRAERRRECHQLGCALQPLK